MSSVVINLLEEKEKCSACGACMAVCPKKAIKMVEDECGYFYPSIDNDLCIGCGKCIRTCTYRTKPEANETIEAYAAISTKKQVLDNCASGGIFGSIASNFIKTGSVVGAIFDSNGKKREVYHCVTNNSADLPSLQGSKYVQSSAWKSYSEISELLKKGEHVLFTGTPCQVDAIKRITGNPDNLFTIDLICHGVPPMKMLNEFLDGFSKIIAAPIDRIIFRDNKIEVPFHARIKAIKRGHSKDYILHSELLSYYKYFLNGKFYRENCYSCQYACGERCGDLTIGDYWGIEKYHSDLINKDEYWSCVLVNTAKGKYLLEKYGTGIKLYESKFDWVKEQNKQLVKPSIKPDDRDSLLNAYKSGGYQAVEKKFRKSRNGDLRYLRQVWKEILSNRKYSK